MRNMVAPFELIGNVTYLRAGYIVSSLDYEGPDAAFSPGHLLGLWILAMIRAVTNFHRTLGFPVIASVRYFSGAITIS